jgi:hypothetical protein
VHKKIDYSFEGKIWNTAFNSQYIVLEIRDETRRQVNFSAISLTDGAIKWEGLQPHKSWWLGLVGVEENYVIIHQYSSNQKPESIALFILEVATGVLVKHIIGKTFFKLEGQLLTTSEIDETNQPIYADYSLGLAPVSKSIIHEDNDVSITNFSTIQKPIHYLENGEYFPVIFRFLYRLLAIEAQKAVDYLEISNKIIISYYIYTGKLYQNYILVVNKEREILLNDLIAESEGIGIDTFTVKSDTLLYVKNQNKLIGYEL